MLAASLTLCCALGGVPQAQAQVSAKAYAPDNIGSLAVPDRIRVIEKEYAEQARGRRIPDDQLEFYLVQVQRSRWTFSQIKQDIATSLGGGGNGGGWRPTPITEAPAVVCESNDQRYVQCETQFRGRAMVARQLSSTRCVEGQTFGSRPGLIWVRGGCRARFVEDTRYEAPPQVAREVICESRDNRQRECRTGFRGRTVLSRQLSDRPCVEGSNWGARGPTVWVDRGCRATFVEDERGNTGGATPSNYNVTCSSDDDRYKTCAWTATAGRPRLIEQLSKDACIEGRTWGYDRREGLWVDRGCRGRFGSY
jgi:hypothetical protein